MFCSTGDPKLRVGQVLLLEAWGTEAKKPQICRKILFLWRGRLNRALPEHVRLLGLGPPGLPKKYLARTPLRDPLGSDRIRGLIYF